MILDMKAVCVCASIMLFKTSFCLARPQKTSLDRMMENGPLNFNSLDPEYRQGNDHINLLDGDQWKEMLTQGRVREMIDTIQRVLGSKNPVRVRTQWGGPQSKDIRNTIRNTINWNAFRGDKSNLNLIMDSKFARNNGKVDVINPNIGVSFQLKY